MIGAQTKTGIGRMKGKIYGKMKAAGEDALDAHERSSEGG
jgi:hypothetical protein